MNGINANRSIFFSPAHYHRLLSLRQFYIKAFPDGLVPRILGKAARLIHSTFSRRIFADFVQWGSF